MLVTKQGKKYIDDFFESHPKTFSVQSYWFKHGKHMSEMVNWTKENIQSDTLMTFGPDKNEEGAICIIWYVVDIADVTAIKLRWKW